MRVNRWFGLQLALLSICCSTLAQSNLRSNVERTQDFQPIFPEAQFQSSPQSQQQQNQLQTGQFPDIKSLELQQQQFRESVAQARERARTAQLETTTQNIPNNFISQAPVQQFPSQEFPQSQQRRLQTNQQRRPVAIKQRLLQPTTQPQVQQQPIQPQFRQSQFPQQTIQPQIRQQKVSSETQQNFQAQQPVISQVSKTQLQKDASRKPDFSKAEEDLIRQQAENAHYSFGTTVVDNIMDNSQMRTETRNGLQVEGMYSYSDGYYKRTVFYEADNNGYRVLKEEVMPIGDGPQLDLDGKADIDTNVDGIENRYTITAADVPFLLQQQNQQ